MDPDPESRPRKRSKTKEQYVQECREWLARRKAFIEQWQRTFDMQYPMMSPRTNRRRLEDLEAWKFEVEVHEWELEGIVNSPDEEWGKVEEEEDEA